jgi:hypothetical protein
MCRVIFPTADNIPAMLSQSSDDRIADAIEFALTHRTNLAERCSG